MRSINPFVKISVYPFAFDSHLFSSTPSESDSPSSSTAPLSPRDFHRTLAREQMEYTMIVDCTDTPTSRHFINAFALAYRIPLVSGGAVRTDGIVGVYALPLASTSKQDEATPLPVETGPCYACVFPSSPPPIQPFTPSSDPHASPAEQKITDDAAALARERLEESAALLGTGACSDEGVLGLLCGAVGLGMGSEVTRVILGLGQSTLPLCLFREATSHGRRYLSLLCLASTMRGTGEPDRFPISQQNQLFISILPSPMRRIERSRCGRRSSAARHVENTSIRRLSTRRRCLLREHDGTPLYRA